MKVYDRNVVNKYRLYLLHGVIIFNLIDYISICTDAELLIIYIYYITLRTPSSIVEKVKPLVITLSALSKSVF